METLLTDMRQTPVAALTDLFHRRWAPSILSELSLIGGGTIAGLIHSLGGSRGGIRDGLDELVGRGLVRHWGGHTHPLRPEFTLTKEGIPVAAAATALLQALAKLDATELALKKWPIPTLAAIPTEGLRFSDFRMHLGPITDRALSVTLAHLQDHCSVFRTFAPSPSKAIVYQLTEAGRFVNRLALELAAKIA